MWGSRETPASTDREAALAAWVQWRQAAELVRALWADVVHAPRNARAAAYAQYGQALRREEHAAAELAARASETPVSAIAA